MLTMTVSGSRAITWAALVRAIFPVRSADTRRRSHARYDIVRHRPAQHFIGAEAALVVGNIAALIAL